MARKPVRPPNRQRENEDMRIPAQPGEPPRSATEPPGSEWSVRSDQTLTDPSSGEPNEAREERRRSPAPKSEVKSADGSSPRTSG